MKLINTDFFYIFVLTKTNNNSIMRYVQLTEDQVKKIPTKKIGLTSGKRDKITGIRPAIKFCSSFDFSKHIGYDEEKVFIEI